MSSPDPTAVHANAYAIAYRLLGDRPAAHATVTVAVERVHAAGGLDRPDWLNQVAAATVAQAVDLAASGVFAPVATPTHEGLRAAMRRRLASASDDERVAASLHHLAGYPVDAVAGFMGRPAEEVARLAGALAPPPGVSYRDLGDPELIGRAEPPRPSRRRRVSVSTVLTVVVVLALVLAVSRCVGPRPTLGPEPEREAVRIGPDVPVTPSSGCDGPFQRGGTATATASWEGRDVAFRLAVPEPTAPRPNASAEPGAASTTTPSATGPVARPLVVAVADTGQTADSFAADSGLERDGLETGYVVATVAPPEPGTTAAVDAVGAVVDTLLRSICVDAGRVAVVGLGSGGQVATALACETASTVVAVVAVGGATLPSDCRLSPAVSLELLWAADDEVLPPAGGYGPRAMPPSQAAPPLPPMPAGEVTRDWALAIGADRPGRTTSADGTIVEEATSPEGAAVRWVTAPTGGHTWTTETSVEVLAFARDHGRSG